MLEVSTALEQKKLGDLDDRVVGLLAGTYAWKEFPDPIRVGKFVERVERSVPGFQEQHRMLSEYAHPNARGTTDLYSTIDRENIFVDFGLRERNTKPAKALCAANLGVTLMLFELTYNHLSDLMPEFVKLCEREITATLAVSRRVSFGARNRTQRNQGLHSPLYYSVADFTTGMVPGERRSMSHHRGSAREVSESPNSLKASPPPPPPASPPAPSSIPAAAPTAPAAPSRARPPYPAPHPALSNRPQTNSRRL